MTKILKSSFLALALVAFGGMAQAETAVYSQDLKVDGIEFLRPGYGRPGRPGRPGWGRPGRPGYPAPAQRECFARNNQGTTFVAWGFDADYNLQNQVMNYCFNNSYYPNSCAPLGCRWR